MKFFLDANLSPHHARGMSAFAAIQQHTVAHLRDMFPPEVTDREWISALGAEGGWIIISGDIRITRNPAEKAAWHESGLTAFFFAPPFANTNYWSQASELMDWWPRIAEQALRTPTGHGFLMPKKGKELKQLYP